MPLSKSITDQSGVTTTYWVISHAQADIANQTCAVTLAGYLDADAYATKKNPSARRPFFFSVPFSSLPSIASGSISMAELYLAVMTMIADPKRAVPSPLAGATLVA